MELVFSDDGRTIEFERELSSLDNMAFDFVRILETCGMKYVVVSGYVFILFGRSRMTEDIDVLVERIPFDEFEVFWRKAIVLGYVCINSENAKDAFSMLDQDGLAVRFCAGENVIPNIELKFLNDKLDYYSLKNRVEVVITTTNITAAARKTMFVSPFEIQVAYKMFLGSEKDYEDAEFLFELFKDKINMVELTRLLELLEVDQSVVEDYLRGL